MPLDSYSSGSPSVKANPVSQIVSTFQQQTLIFGDFFERWKEAGIGQVDLILADPPFGLFARELKNMNWDISLDLAELETILNQLIKPTGQVILFCDLNLLVEFMTGFKRLKFRCLHIWKKPGGMPVNLTHPIKNAEFILVFRKSGVRVGDLTFNTDGMGVTGPAYIKRNYTHEIPTRRMKKSAVNENPTGIRYPKCIIEAPSKPNMAREERTSHPTQKPVLLLRKLIRTYSNSGDLVVDPFLGSGSTLVACHKEKRKGIGYEIKEQYYQEASRRIRQITCQGVLW